MYEIVGMFDSLKWNFVKVFFDVSHYFHGSVSQLKNGNEIIECAY